MPETHLGGSLPTAQPIFAPILRCIAALACGVSLALTLRFCLGLRTSDDLFATTLAGAMAVCWEASKYAFAAAAVIYVRCGRGEQIVGGVALGALSGALLVGSIAASLSHLEQTSAEHREQALTQSRQYQDLTARLEGLDAELATLRATAAQDAQHGYRARALTTIADARRLAEQRNAIAVQRDFVSASAASASASTASVLHPLSAALGTDAVTLRLWVNLAIALLLEAIGAVSVLLLTAAKQARREVETHQDQSRGRPASVHYQSVSATVSQPQPDASAHVLHREAPQSDPADCIASEPSTHPHPDAGTSYSNSDGCSRDLAWSHPDAATAHPQSNASDVVVYERLRERVIDGDIAPSYRSVQKSLHVGQNRAKRLLRKLCEQGILDRRGRGFELRHCT